MYNISWRHSSSDMVEKSMVVNVTNYTISDLMPGQTYSVQICAVREGYSPNYTEPKEYRTVQGELQTHCFMHVYLVSMYVCTVRNCCRMILSANAKTFLDCMPLCNLLLPSI